MNLALLDGLHEQVVHLLLGGILGQEEDIEAGVSRGKPDTVYDKKTGEGGWMEEKNIQGGELLKKPVRVGTILSNDQFQLGKSSNRDPVAEDHKVRLLPKMFSSGVGRPTCQW